MLADCVEPSSAMIISALINQWLTFLVRFLVFKSRTLISQQGAWTLRLFVIYRSRDHQASIKTSAFVAGR